jgi:hypothetical protein
MLDQLIENPSVDFGAKRIMENTARWARKNNEWMIAVLMDLCLSDARDRPLMFKNVRNVLVYKKSTANFLRFVEENPIYLKIHPMVKALFDFCFATSDLKEIGSVLMAEEEDVFFGKPYFDLYEEF